MKVDWSYFLPLVGSMLWIMLVIMMFLTLLDVNDRTPFRAALSGAFKATLKFFAALACLAGLFAGIFLVIYYGHCILGLKGVQ